MINYSVLIPVYYKDNPVFFNLALESILNQTIKSNDIVLVCDGPLTIELENVISRNKTEAFNIVRLPNNSGLGIALNEGLKYCKNSIVLRADSDDYSIPTRAEIELEYMLSHKLDLVGSFVSEFTDDIECTSLIKKVPVTKKKIDKYCKTRCPFNHPSVMFDKKIVMEAGGYMDFPFFEDYYLWARIIALKKFNYGNIDKCLVLMRTGNNDELLKRRFSKKAMNSSYSIIKKLKQLKIINWFEYFIILLSRKMFNVLPFKIKKYFYKNILRTKKSG